MIVKSTYNKMHSISSNLKGGKNDWKPLLELKYLWLFPKIICMNSGRMYDINEKSWYSSFNVNPSKPRITQKKAWMMDCLYKIGLGCVCEKLFWRMIDPSHCE